MAFHAYVYTCTQVNVEWDARKAASNFRKHGIRFPDVVSALEDPQALTIADESHGEERWVTIAMDALARIVVVVWTPRGRNIRIISARTATAREQASYLEGA
ncbi:membrane protein [Bryobacterales bacterium F-183]|nr:membrane protein [Bryobacterales bacterium F-183]